MSDYPMLISNKLHSFRNFLEQDYSILLRYFSFGLYRLKSYRVWFEQEKNILFVSN